MKVIQVATEAESPKGAPFIVDRCDFLAGGCIPLEYSSRDIERDKLENWPMVYILANDEEAYVGQTTSITRRMGQHGANPEKIDFTTVNIIFNREFNASVITDYEHRLIQYMHGDGRCRLANKNDGMTDTNYFSKSKYEEMFEDLWGDLRQCNLAEKTLEQIEESDVFKYSPYKGLNIDQQIALDEILTAIGTKESISQPLVVEGMPGTGKTVLAIYLLKRLKDDDKYKDFNIRLMEPATALRKTLRKALGTVSGLSAADVISPADLAKPKYGFRGKGKKGFDIVLVDESHLLKRRVNLGTQFGNFDKTCAALGLPQGSSQFQWILSQARLPVFFYDPLQSIGPSGVTPKELEHDLGSALQNPIRLESQMRVKGGKRFLVYIEIEGIKLRWNRVQENWVGLGMEAPDAAREVGCIHSIQGYDLSCAYVIIGRDIRFDSGSGRLIADKANYFDKNGKNTATQEELDAFIRNVYYVLLTRGICGTHIYVIDSGLRRYLSRFFPSIGA